MSRGRPKAVPGHAVTWLDVFTDRPLAGNGLAVVHGADDLGDETMLAVARETRLSETTFVQTATQDGANYRAPPPSASPPATSTFMGPAGRVQGRAAAQGRTLL